MPKQKSRNPIRRKTLVTKNIFIIRLVSITSILLIIFVFNYYLQGDHAQKNQMRQSRQVLGHKATLTNADKYFSVHVAKVKGNNILDPNREFVVGSLVRITGSNGHSEEKRTVDGGIVEFDIPDVDVTYTIQRLSPSGYIDIGPYVGPNSTMTYKPSDVCLSLDRNPGCVIGIVFYLCDPTRSEPCPAPTPIPESDGCRCMDMNATQIIPGHASTFSMMSSASNTNIVKDVEFMLQSSDGLISGPENIPAKAQISNDKAEYNSQWTVDIPTDLKKGTDYTVSAKINCAPKIVMNQSGRSVSVLGEADIQPKQNSIISQIIAFFQTLFSQNSSDNSQPPNNEEDYKSLSRRAGQQLQLGNFTPAHVVENKCSSLKFRFE